MCKGVKKQRKHRKSVFARGPKTQKVTCCICEKMVELNNALIPAKCFKVNIGKAHRICQDCWWGTEKHPGFAQEGPSHNCPGCEKGLPLTEFQKESSPIVLIDDS
jgi:hypothetical protein